MCIRDRVSALERHVSGVDHHIGGGPVDAQQLVVRQLLVGVVLIGLDGEQPAAAHGIMTPFLVERDRIGGAGHIDLLAPVGGDGQRPALSLIHICRPSVP